MTFLEFFKLADIDDKDPLRRIVDLRPFAERQDEALYFYLREIVERTMKYGKFITDRRIVFRWDTKANFTDASLSLLRSLQDRSVPIELEPGATSASA